MILSLRTRVAASLGVSLVLLVGVSAISYRMFIALEDIESSHGERIWAESSVGKGAAF